MNPVLGPQGPPVPIGLVIGQLGQGGAERQLFYLATALDRGRFEPTVFCLSQQVTPYGPWLEAAGVPVVALPRRGHFDLMRVARLARAARRRCTRLLHAFLLDASAYTVLAAPLCGSPVVLASNRVCRIRRRPLHKALDRWALARSDAVIVNSDEVLRFTRDEYGVSTARLRRIYNGLDAAPFADVAQDQSVRASLGAREAHLLVVAVGRIEPQKSPALFVEVAARVAAHESRARFAWVGAGSGGAALERLVAERGLGDRLRLIGSRQDIAAVLGATDLLLQTSESEGLPNVVLEAMAAGVPTVATDVGGTREALGDTGRLRAAGDAEGLASDVLSLLADPVARASLGRRARERVRREFPLERMVRETEAMYGEFLERRSRVARGAGA